jgi:hypothetical protein
VKFYLSGATPAFWCTTNSWASFRRFEIIPFYIEQLLVNEMHKVYPIKKTKILATCKKKSKFLMGILSVY